APAAGLGVVGAGLGPTVGEEVPDARNEESASPSAGVPAPFPPLQPRPQSPTLVTRREPDEEPPRTVAGGIKGFARRNLVAAGAGALLVAVLGTVVTLGATSENDGGDPSNEVGVNPSASQGVDDGSLGADRPSDDGQGQETPGAPTGSATPGTSEAPTATESGAPSQGPSSTGSTDPGDDESPDDPGSPDEPSKSPSSPTTKPTSPKPTDTEPTDPGTPTESDDTSPTPTETETTSPSTPETSDTVSGADSPPATVSQSSTESTGTGTPAGSDPGTGQII
ncbi:ATP-binding protein, partial [Streptomyces rubrogriseus]|nr:ATP-binding protein [Streptomyces rubrogriseus]